MTELREALEEINAIRAQVARDTQFRGYDPSTIAASGILALMVAGLEAHGSKAMLAPLPFLATWVATAGLSMVLTTFETVRRAKRVHCALASEMLQSAVEQFVPAVAVGALLTVVLMRVAPQSVWMLPGLWELMFSLGVFASCRFLPRQMFAVGVWYLASGLTCLAMASEVHSLNPWAMGIPFGIGQLLVAAVLRYGYGNIDEED